MSGMLLLLFDLLYSLLLLSLGHFTRVVFMSDPEGFCRHSRRAVSRFTD